MSKKINIGFDTSGESGFSFISVLLRHAFGQNLIITNDKTKNIDLIIKGPFSTPKNYKNEKIPYILCSFEFYESKKQRKYEPLFKTLSFTTNKDKCFYLPQMSMTPINYDKFTLFKQSTERLHNLVYINSNPIKIREDFYKYFKSIDPEHTFSHGKCQNSGLIPGVGTQAWRNSFILMRDFKTAIAMENNNIHGYITEKIINAYKAGCVPIYWGSEGTIYDYFNKDSFIDVSNFDDYKKCADFVLEVCKDKQKLVKYYDANKFKDNKLPDLFRWNEPEPRPWMIPMINILQEDFTLKSYE